MIKHALIFTVLLFSFNVLAVTPAKPVSSAEQLQTFLDNTHSLSARFQQKLVDQYGFLIQQSAGQLTLKRPGRFRWDYILPYPQNIISNGKKIWMYDSELEQVNVRPYEQILSSSPVMLLDKKQKLKDNFIIEPMADDDGQQWVQLTPKDTDSDFKQMAVGLLGGVIRSMRFTDSFNQQTEIVFEQLIVNPDIKASRFEFDPPPGTDVVGDF